MYLATWSIRNPVPVLLLFALLAFAGLRGFQALPKQYLPDVEVPTVSITLRQPGAAPAQLETEVARKAEDSIAALPLVRHIYTSIENGQVRIRAQFEFKKNRSAALIETKDAIDRIRADLPADVQPPTVEGVISGDMPILTYAVQSSRWSEEELSWLVDDQIARTVRKVPGVGRIERLGGADREVLIEVDPVRLASLGVTAAEVSRGLRGMQQQTSGGHARIGDAEQSIRTVGVVDQAAALASLPIIVDDGRRLRLDEVARVVDTTAERTAAAFLGGETVVGLRIYRAKGSDETTIATKIDEAVAQLRARDPTLRIIPIVDASGYTREQYRGSMQMLYEGSLLAVVVVFIFLRDWRATLVAATALPLSILPTFAVISWLGYSLNTLTLLALAVVVGILVDDAIVEIENIERHRRMGKTVREATTEAVSEIALAVVATTLTLAVVFIPTSLMPGFAGLYFQQFGWTAVTAILASLLVARLLTPVMAAYLLKPMLGHGAEVADQGRVMHWYLGLVGWCLRHRRVTVAGAVAFFIGSISLIAFIPTGLMPVSDVGYTTVAIDLPPGSTFSSTKAVAEQAKAQLAPIKEIRTVFTTIGAEASAGSGRSAAGVGHATLLLLLKPRDQRHSQSEVENEVRRALADIPGVRSTVGSGLGSQISLILTGDNTRTLMSATRTFEQQLRGLGIVSNVTSTASQERPEIVVHPDLQRAGERGISTEAIGETIRIATSGDFDQQLAKLNLDNRQIPIRVRVAEQDLGDLTTISQLMVRSSDGLVPISSVAEVSSTSGPVSIERYDRRRFTHISADLGGVPLGQATKAALSLPIAQDLPAGVELSQTGDGEQSAELIANFGTAVLTGILCMYCVLVLLFRDFISPITILTAIPLSLGGAFVALLMSGSELDVPAMIGLLMLIGVVTKNSILLVESAVSGQLEGRSAADAILEACEKRARPIVMTTIAMIAGMFPVALGAGSDASFRQPMAIAVIGGLVTSTLLCLVVIPTVFSLTDSFKRRVQRRLNGVGGLHFRRRSPSAG